MHECDVYETTKQLTTTAVFDYYCIFYLTILKGFQKSDCSPLHFTSHEYAVSTFVKRACMSFSQVYQGFYANPKTFLSIRGKRLTLPVRCKPRPHPGYDG